MVRTIETMGTVVSIRAVAGPGGDKALFPALAKARFEFERADAVFSTWKPDSPLSRLRRGEIGPGNAPPEVSEVLDRCALARRLTGGWFDPWRAPGGVDPTGLVKGWAAQRALAAILDGGATAAVVNAGGDAALWGTRATGQPWRIGVQNPFDRATVAVVVEPGAAIATSGCYERGAHIFDPFTGLPASAVASATVTGPDLDLADAMATALVAGGRQALARVASVAGYEALLIGHDGRFVRTPGFPEAATAVA